MLNALKVFAIFASLIGTANGNQYVVATTGLDTNPGTAALPFATLVKAVTLLKPGDVVTVQTGTYAGVVCGWDAPRPSIVGTAAQPITIQAQGLVTLTRNSKTANGIDLISCAYVVVDGFNLPNLGLKGVSVTTSPNITIQNCTITGSGTWGIYTTHSDNTVIQNCSISGSINQHGVYIANSAVNPTITGCRVFNNANCGLQINGDVSQGLPGYITGANITNNVITGNGRTGGAAINCDGVINSTFQNNLLIGNLSSGIALFQVTGAVPSTGNLVTNNLVSMASTAKYCIGVKNGSINNILNGNVMVPPKNNFGLVMDAASLKGTQYLTTGSFVYSIDNGLTGISQTTFLAAVTAATPKPAAPANPFGPPTTK